MIAAFALTCSLMQREVTLVFAGAILLAAAAVIAATLAYVMKSRRYRCSPAF